MQIGKNIFITELDEYSYKRIPNFLRWCLLAATVAANARNYVLHNNNKIDIE